MKLSDLEQYEKLKKEIPAIQARCKVASSAPWSVHRYSVDDCNGNQVCGDFTHDGDKMFIANARQDIPLLLDEREKLIAEIAIKDAEIERLKVRAEAFERAIRAFECSTGIFSFACFCCSYKNKTNFLKCELLGDEICVNMENWQFDEARFTTQKERKTNG